MNTNGIFSSSTDEWETPQELYDTLNDEFHFTIDVCATPENAKVARYFTKEDDGLKQTWGGTCWMNPPYGRQIAQWVAKAWYSARDGATVVCLLPARTDTGWWHVYCMRGEIRFIRGRVRFGGCKQNAPFPSAVVIFRNLGVMSNCRSSATST